MNQLNNPVRTAALLAILAGPLALVSNPAPASAMQVLDAVDHAELSAEVSATSVSRIALSADRIARVIRSPGGFETEHDPGSGDLYLRPLEAGIAPARAQPGADGDDGADDDGETVEPETATVALFIGTEKGFTYRLTLTMAERAPAQILIRNAAAMADRGAVPAAGGSDRNAAGEARIGALVALVRAVARREPLAGFTIAAAGNAAGRTAGSDDGGDAGVPGRGSVRLIETWRGPRFEARVVEIPEDVFAAESFAGAAGLAARLGPVSGKAHGNAPGIAAAWLAGPGTGPHGGRIAVLVRETSRLSDRASGRAPAGDPR